MKVIDPGHLYDLDMLDAGASYKFSLRFVKRVGEKYPGNEGPPYPGVTSQEVIRALIERSKYVDEQRHCPENAIIEARLRDALWLLELRAARARDLEAGLLLGTDCLEAEEALYRIGTSIELAPTCAECGHVFCSGCPA